jgi:hypothetical protein
MRHLYAAVVLTLVPTLTWAKTFHCPAGDVACFVASIDQANASGQKNTILLEAGTYTLMAVNNTAEGDNGLPMITSALTITGEGAATTIIERRSDAPAFRIMVVAASGTLTLNKVTIRGGFTDLGGGILNDGGVLTVTESTITNNQGLGGGSGLGNRGGIVTLTDSTITNNQGGGLGNNGTMNLTRCVVSSNRADFGGGIFNRATLTITDSTIAFNRANYDGGGIWNDIRSTLTITNSAFVGNRAGDNAGGGITNAEGTVTILNSTFARNQAPNHIFLGTGGAILNRETLFSEDHTAQGGVITLINSTIAENQGYIGGGVANARGTIIL